MTAGIATPLRSTEAEFARSELLSQLSYLTPHHIDSISAACAYADLAHDGVKRKSGEPYITHPIAVAVLLTHYHADSETLQASLLHDVIEDTHVSKQELADLFGAKVAEMVDGVTKLKTDRDHQHDKIASLRKMLLATLREPRVILIKLVDRLHNMSTLASFAEEKRRRIAKETLDVFIPMAHLVGMPTLADELEKRCLENLDPLLFNKLNHTLTNHTQQRLDDVQKWQQQIQQLLKKLTISADCIPQQDLHFLFQLFFFKDADIDSLLITHGFTIITQRIEDCFAISKALCADFAFSECLDYINHPQPGGLQALKLELRDERGVLRITIQTIKMRDHANWDNLLEADKSDTRRSVIQASLANLESFLNEESAQQSIKGIIDYFHQEKILTYTPRGDVHELPNGATAVDFAYAASNFVGNHAVGAIVDNQPKPLATPLKNGQTIRIITDVLAGPNADWLSFVNTPKARRGIQNTIKSLPKTEQILLGKQALVRAFKSHQLDMHTLGQSEWHSLLQWQNLDSLDALYENIAIGDVIPQLVVSRYLASTDKHDDDTHHLLRDVRGVEVQYAKCCSPIFGDPIMGHLSKRGLVIHRNRCTNLVREQSRHPETVIKIDWQTDTSENPRFSVKLLISTLLGAMQSTDLIELVTHNKGAVEKFQSSDNKTHITLIVRDRDHLANLIKHIRVMLNFPRVTRLDN